MISPTHPPAKSQPTGWLKYAAAAAWVALSGCATDTLTLAPASPDTPWQFASQEPNPVAVEPTTPSAVKYFTIPSVPKASVLPVMPALNNEHLYSLAELIDIAQRENPDTHLAWNRAKQAALAVGVAQATFLPMLSANVIGGWQNTRTPVPLLPGNQNVETELHGVVPALALEWLIFDFGQRKAITDGAKHASYAG